MATVEPLKPPRKRLALFFDGTWDAPQNNTNVWRLKLMLAERGQNGVEQRCFYDEGVGTHWYDHLTGGAFGVGLADNVRSGVYELAIEVTDQQRAREIIEQVLTTVDDPVEPAS